MKYLTLALGPTQFVFHPLDRCFVRAGIPRTVLHLSAQFDETCIVLYRLVGDHTVIETTIEQHEDVLDYTIVPISDTTDTITRPPNTSRPLGNGATGSGSTNGTGVNIDLHAFIHLDMSTTAGRIVELAHEHTLIIDTPITFDGDAMRVTLIGVDTDLRHVLQSLPDSIDISVHDAGEYDPTTDDLLSPLTDRQLEVFETAVEHGYYDVPRRATHRDIADELGCAPSTVDEHLRKAESSIVPHLFTS